MPLQSLPVLIDRGGHETSDKRTIRAILGSYGLCLKDRGERGMCVCFIGWRAPSARSSAVFEPYGCVNPLSFHYCDIFSNFIPINRRIVIFCQQNNRVRFNIVPLAPVGIFCLVVNNSLPGLQDAVERLFLTTRLRAPGNIRETLSVDPCCGGWGSPPRIPD